MRAITIDAMSIPGLADMSPTRRRIVVIAMALWPTAEEPLAAATPAPEPPAPASVPHSPTPSATPTGLAHGDVIATTAVEMLDVHDEPGGDIIHTLDEWSEYFQPLTLMAVDRATHEDAEWLQVDLPMKPNGQRGWIRADDVTTSSTTRHVHIYLDEGELDLVDGDEVLLSADVVIGDDETPTPPGTYYITDPQEYPNPSGVYGAYALGLSGYSEVLDSFYGGPRSWPCTAPTNPSCWARPSRTDASGSPTSRSWSWQTWSNSAPPSPCTPRAQPDKTYRAAPNFSATSRMRRADFSRPAVSSASSGTSTRWSIPWRPTTAGRDMHTSPTPG